MAAQHGLVSRDYLLYSQGVDVLSGAFRYPVTRNIPLSDAASLNFSVHIDVEDVNLGAGETIKFYLQQLRNDQWMDVGDPQAVVEVDSGDGTYCILLSIGVEMEALVLPLSNVARLTIDTGPSSTCTVTKVTTYDRV
jgi:hypothetical protein